MGTKAVIACPADYAKASELVSARSFDGLLIADIDLQLWQTNTTGTDLAFVANENSSIWLMTASTEMVAALRAQHPSLRTTPSDRQSLQDLMAWDCGVRGPKVAPWATQFEPANALLERWDALLKNLCDEGERGARKPICYQLLLSLSDEQPDQRLA